MIRPKYRVRLEDQDENIILRFLLWGEARNQSVKGILAIAFVCKNRALVNDTTIKYEALKFKQFSCFNPDDPNRRLMELSTEGKQLVGWDRIDTLAGAFETLTILDPTEGATHYYNPKVVKPIWGEGHPRWKLHVVIGDHNFGIAG